MTISRVFFNSLAGYALSRLQFRGRSVVFGLFIAVMTVPSVVLMIPRFLLIKELGMFDTYFGMILPCSWTRRESSSSPGRAPNCTPSPPVSARSSRVSSGPATSSP